MIQPLHNSSPQASAVSKSSSAGSNGGAGFASALASAQSGTDSASEGTITGGLQTTLKPPKGETWGPVPGHTDYADILGGPRDGFFVDLASGPRQGKAFVIVHRHGKTFHVYGEGKHKQEIEVPSNPADYRPPKGETWKPVEHHHDYKKIDGGERKNKFVNLSGNTRTGEAFTIEHHDGKTWHLYGSGRNRHEVAVGGHSHRHAPATSGSPSTPTPSNPPTPAPGNPSLPG